MDTIKLAFSFLLFIIGIACNPPQEVKRAACLQTALFPAPILFIQGFSVPEIKEIKAMQKTKEGLISEPQYLSLLPLQSSDTLLQSVSLLNGDTVLQKTDTIIINVEHKVYKIYGFAANTYVIDHNIEQCLYQYVCNGEPYTYNSQTLTIRKK